MERFTSSPLSDVPVGLLRGISVGPATTGGCTCVRSSQGRTDDLALELEAIVRANEYAASNLGTQP